MKQILTSIIAISVSAFVATAADEAKPAAPAEAPAKKGKGEGKKGGSPEDMFKKLDSNSDGSISLDEFKAGPAGKKDAAKAEEVFKKKDKDIESGVLLFSAFLRNPLGTHSAAATVRE